LLGHKLFTEPAFSAQTYGIKMTTNIKHHQWWTTDLLSYSPSIWSDLRKLKASTTLFVVLIFDPNIEILIFSSDNAFSKLEEVKFWSEISKKFTTSFYGGRL